MLLLCFPCVGSWKYSLCVYVHNAVVYTIEHGWDLEQSIFGGCARRPQHRNIPQNRRKLPQNRRFLMRREDDPLLALFEAACLGSGKVYTRQYHSRGVSFEQQRQPEALVACFRSRLSRVGVRSSNQVAPALTSAPMDLLARPSFDLAYLHLENV